MRYTIDEIRQMPEGQTFDCKSFRIDPKALANTIVAMANADGGIIAVGISDQTRRKECVDRMCRELASTDTPELKYAMVAFIMKATVYAHILEDEEETTQTGLQTGLQTSSQTPDKLLQIIAQNGNVTTEQMAKALGVSRQAVAKHIKKLQEQGLIQRIGSRFKGHWEIIEQTNFR